MLYKSTLVNPVYQLLNLLLIGSFSASSDVTFANSLDPDQSRPSVGLDLDANCLTLQ